MAFDAEALFADVPKVGAAPAPPAGFDATALFADVPKVGESKGSFIDAATSGQVPGFIDSLHPPATPAPGADQSVPLGSVGRGFNQLQQGLTMLGAEAGIISPATAAKAIAQDEADKAQYPIPPSMKAAQKAMGEAKGWGEATLIALQNPGMLASVVGESVPASAAMLAAGAVGTVAGPAGTMAGVGAVSGSTEYASSILDQMQEAKIDLKDTAAIEKALQDPTFMSKAREKAVKRGLAVGAFDAISMGLAGRIAKVMGATAEGASTARRLAGGVAETGAQAASGAGGEAAAQVATEGEIKDKTAVILEALSEVVTGAPEVALGMAQQAVPAPAPPDVATDTGVLPPEEGAPPPRTMVVNDPPFTSTDGEEFPAGELHGQTVEVLDGDEISSRVRLPDGSETSIGNDLLTEPPTPAAGEAPGRGYTPELMSDLQQLGWRADQVAGKELPELQDIVANQTPPPAPKDTAVAAAAPAQAAEAAAVPDSPRLTPSDRSSPIPNELIDAGKALVESASGKPSTFTTTTEINGERKVVTGNVSDLVAGNRAEVEAIASRIMQGVSTPEILAGSLPAAAESAVPGVAATSGPSTAAAPVAPSIATPEAAPEVTLAPSEIRGAPAAEAPMMAASRIGPAITPDMEEQLTRRYGPPGTQARRLEESRLSRPEPYTAQTPAGDTITVEHPNYETFRATINGVRVGELNVSPLGAYASSVKVEPSARRQGVATAMYAAAEQALGRNMIPSPMFVSGDAMGFWKRRMADMEPEEKQAALQETLDIGAVHRVPKSARERVDALGYVEPTDARIEGETDKVFAKRVVDKRPEPTELSENYPDYFIMTGAKVVPIGDLVSSKTDEENAQGGGNAAKRMAAAAKGELDKRAPITVQKMADGKYLIKDGNGTYTSVKALGWKAMPVLVESGVAAAPSKSATATEPAAQAALKEKIAAKRATSEQPKFAVSAKNEGPGVLTETNEPVGEGHLTSFTGETATPEQRATFYRHPYTTIDALYEDAQARQDELGEVGKAIADKIKGVTFANPGLKSREKSTKKIPLKGYENAGQISDAIRAGFNVSEPGLANQIIREMARHFEVLDEGWSVTKDGYFDRKILIRFDDGRVAEIQFWEPHLLQAKEEGLPGIVGGVKGHALYDDWNILRKDDPSSPKLDELSQQMRELYGHALSLASSLAWAKVVSAGKLSKPDPKYLNLRRQSSSVISRQDWNTSPKSASTQSVEPGLSSALASKSVSTTGRSSQLQNSIRATPPSGTNVVQTQPERKGKDDGETPRFQARTLREGSETAESIGLPPTREVTTPKGKTLLKKIVYNTYKIAVALQARQRARYGTIGRDDRSDEAKDRIADWMVEEVEFEMQPGREQRSGVGWYSTRFQRALDAFASIFPELTDGSSMMSSSLPGLQQLKTKKNARNFFTALIAVTSDGAVVASNFAHAARLYREFRQTGSIDIDAITEGADRNASMKTNIGNILKLLAEKGPDGMHTMLMEEDTVSNLKKKSSSTDAEFTVKLQAHMRMPLAALIFGPKLGAFYANLMGAHGYLTMDRWWSRTFNRYRGQLIKKVSGTADRPTDRQGNKIGLARFKEMIGQPNLSDDEALLEAYRHSKLYEDKGFKNGTAVEKAANTIRKDTIGTEDTPFGITDRTFMIETVERAREKLAARGITISLADIQAILWYYEKRLYSELGARETADISYEEVARRIAAQGDQGNRPGRPDLQTTGRGEDEASFSLNLGAVSEGRGGADRQRADVRTQEAARSGASQAKAVEPLPKLYDLYPSSVGPNAAVTAAKKAYMKSIGQPYRRQAEYVKADPKRGKKIADAFDAMPHNPQDPEVKAAYRAMIDETVAQFRVLQKELNLKIEFIREGNPYNDSPRLALEDVMNNGHLWVFPTESGFGSTDLDVSDNPLLEQTDIVIDGHKLLANDVFRIVHDIYGHGPEGAGFGPTGEENAWQSHVRMYSPLAARAMTSETRGQNSWVNFGPHGEANRKNPKDTIFADQKIGLLPDWVVTEGLAADEAARFKLDEKERREQARVKAKAVATTKTETRKTSTGTIHFALSDAFKGKADAVFKDLRAALDKLGLGGIDLNVWQQIFADMDYGVYGVDGLYLRKVIDVSLQAKDAMSTLHHEALHALVALKLFTPTELAILKRYAEKHWITDDIKANYPKELWVEEAIANAFGEWSKGRKVDGVLAKSFKKIQAFLKALLAVLTKHDIRTSEDIFEAIAEGKVGKRGRRSQNPVAIAALNPTPKNLDAMFQSAWHGTPHEVDRFTTAKIGTGEGMQAYGWGLYFAGKREVAEWYRGKLSGKNNKGKLYQVDIPENEDLLDYDRPLKVQPEKIQQAVHKLIDKHFLADAKADWADGLSGHHFYDDLSRSLGSDFAASAALREAGIPGHRYLDAGSRGGGEKTTHNYVIYDEAAIAIEARFALQNPPHTTQQANAVMQGFLNRGQPIDRAIRTPFDLLGGLDNQNVWNPGKRLTEKMGSTGLQGAGMAGLIGGAIGGLAGGPVGSVAGFAAGATVGNFLVKANPSPTGVFRWYGPIAENAKRGLIDRYGLSEEYIEAERQADLAKGDILRQAQGILKVLSQAGIGSAESRVLKAILTGQPVNDPDMTRLAVPIRQAIDDLGAEAVSLGLISAESFERNRGAYLHRVYAKNEANQNNLVRWVSKVMGNKRRKIIGDQLKGRGIFLDLTTERLMKDASNYPEPAKGETWRILDRMNAAGDKASKRVYWPANKPVPMEYQGPNWVDRGPWEVRQIGKGKTTLWRDYTETERTKMGEIIDARYLIAKTFMLMANDLSTGRFYKEVAGKAEWTKDTKPEERWMEAGEYSRYWNDPDIAWVKVPDTNIQDTGGKKRWGALAGKYVRAEIWRDLNEVEIASNPRWWRTLMTQWKLNKTARNPVVHANNVMSNLMFMDLADVRLQDLIGGIKAYATSSAMFEEARDNGAFGSDMISQEIRDNVLQPILDEITKQSTGTANPLFAGGMMDKAKVLGIMADKIWSFAKGVDRRMLDAYQAEDEIFRMAAYMRRRSLGDSPKVAALNARDQFLNYDIRAPWINALRGTVLPFISYTYRAVPKLMESIMHRPWKVAKYAAIAYGVNALSYMLDDMDGGDDDDGEERERAALRDQEQGRTWLGVPRMVRMPWRDDHGLPVFLDVRRWIPAGDIFDTSQGSSAIPIPGSLQFGGPLQLAFELVFNKKAFDGKEIVNELTDTPGEQAKNVADWAWKAWAPGAFWIPNSWYWTKISDAVHGATDIYGRPYSVPQAMLSSIGIKVRPLDVEDGIQWHFKDFQKMQLEMEAQFRTVARRLDRGLISQSEFDKALAKTMEKFVTLEGKINAYDKRTQKKPEPVE